MVILRDPARGEIALVGAAAALYDLADGTRSPAELAAAVPADLEDIFAALDELADHGLLAARAAPPAGPRAFTRREVLRTAAAAAAAAVALPALPARAAPDKKATGLTAEEEKQIAAKQPNEQLFKEMSEKREQYHKLESVSWTPGEAAVAPALLMEQAKKAESDLLRGYVDAARAASSADEQKEKARVGAPADLATMEEDKRKAQVQPLRVEEEAAKVVAQKGEQDLKVAAQAEQTYKLAAREQLSKLAGEFGTETEAQLKASVGRSERKRKLLPVSDDELFQAREREAKRLAVGGAAEEQAAKDVLRAREQNFKDAKASKSEEAKLKAEAAGDARLQGAKEKQAKQAATRDQEFAARRSELAAKADEKKKKSTVDKAAEQEFKGARAEQKQKEDAIVTELRAREHEVKSTVQLGGATK